MEKKAPEKSMFQKVLFCMSQYMFIFYFLACNVRNVSVNFKPKYIVEGLIAKFSCFQFFS